MKTLELKEICGYLPYGLYAKIEVIDEERIYKISSLSSNEVVVLIPIVKGVTGYSKKDLSDTIPILRPLSDLYKTITHGGKEIIPIVECAKIAYPDAHWHLSKDGKSAFHATGYDYIYISYCHNSFSKSNGGIANQYLLFDYLHELKIDYRGLIDAGLAVSVYDLEENPYK
ncbi:MAG: hypothetical protein LBR10_14470 [Prevotellaceae bacterium]|jgi:hypothetical protein|nr:hypothetical protein [Prevotellaceae bacterium]